jgi:Protein of unknown function (DUF732)
MAGGGHPVLPARRSHNHTLRMQLAGIAESIVGAAIALAPQASADGQDDNFLALLAQAGVPAHDNIPSVIDYGHQVCQALDGGESASAVVDTLANHGYGEDPSHDLGQYHRTMVRFVRASVTAFCPGHQGMLGSTAGSSGKLRIRLAGQTIPNPPQIPPQPAIKLLVPPAAAPSPAPKQAPPPKQVPPPPPQVVEPPTAGTQGGAGNGGTGSGVNGGGSDSGDVPAQPAPRLPEGHIVLAP